MPPLVARTHPWAEAIIAVSTGVADDLSALAKIPREQVMTYMARAAVLVLSSLYEGLSTVVVEALACGCPS